MLLFDLEKVIADTQIEKCKPIFHPEILQKFITRMK